MQNEPIGTHDELSKDPNGAYSQLVRLQQGPTQIEKWQSKDKPDGTIDVDDNLSWSSTQEMSIRKSTSKGSSRSFRLCRDAPGIVEIQETETGNGAKVVDTRNLLVKHKKSLMARVAKLHKPETPELLLGSVAASAHGVTLPLLGLLLSKSISIMYKPPHELSKDAKILSLFYVGLGIITLLAIPMKSYCLGVAGAKLVQRIRSMSFKKVVHQEISWFDDPKNSRCVSIFII